MRVRRVAARGHDLVANICGCDDPVLGVLLAGVYDHAVDVATPHQRHGVRNAGVRVHDDDWGAHPITHGVGHVLSPSKADKPALYLQVGAVTRVILSSTPPNPSR